MGVQINFPTAGVLSAPVTYATGITAAGTLIAQGYNVIDPTAEFTVNLPLDPESGTAVIVKNISGDEDANPRSNTQIEVQVSGNGRNIAGADTNIILDDNGTQTFIYTDYEINGVQYGWAIF